MLVPEIFSLCWTASLPRYEPAFKAAWNEHARGAPPKVVRDIFVASYALSTGQVPWGAQDAYSSRVLKWWFVEEKAATPEFELLVKKWESEDKQD